MLHSQSRSTRFGWARCSECWRSSPPPATSGLSSQHWHRGSAQRNFWRIGTREFLGDRYKGIFGGSVQGNFWEKFPCTVGPAGAKNIGFHCIFADRYKGLFWTFLAVARARGGTARAPGGARPPRKSTQLQCAGTPGVPLGFPKGAHRPPRNRSLRISEGFWDPWGPAGLSKGPLASPGVPWDPLGSPGAPRGPRRFRTLGARASHALRAKLRQRIGPFRPILCQKNAASPI